MRDRPDIRTGAAVSLALTAAVALCAWEIRSPLALLLPCMVPLALLAMARAPFLVCLAFVLLSFFRLHEALPILSPLHLPMVLAVAALASLAALLPRGRVHLAWTREMRTFSALFALMTVGAVASSGRAIAIPYWLDNYSKIFLMTFAVASLARSRADFSLAGRAFVAAGLLVSSIAIARWMEGVGLVEGNRVTIGRDIRSVLGDPNDLSLVLLFPLSFALSLASTMGVGRAGRLLGALGAAATVAAIACTGSRGGLLGVMAVAGSLVAERVRSRALTLGMGTLPLLALMLLSGLRNHAKGMEGGSMDASSMERLTSWKAAFRMACDHPFLGVGLNNFRANIFFYTDHWDGLARAVHSSWFAALAEGGFVGFALFAALVAQVVQSALRSRRALGPGAAGALYDPETHAMARALVSGAVGFCVAGTFLTQAFTWPIYIILALSVAVAREAGRVTEANRVSCGAGTPRTAHAAAEDNYCLRSRHHTPRQETPDDDHCRSGGLADQTGP
jgi:probable O-glycosylation ligase (exosortase A-associated)